MKSLDGIILAAGYGRRLRPITLKIPKPLVRYGGKPLILYAMEALADAGVSRFLVNAFWLSGRIKAFLEGTFGMEIILSRERVLLGTGGGIRQFRGIVSPIFVVHNSDIIHRVNIARAVRRLSSSNATGLLVLVDGPNNSVLTEGGRVKGFERGRGLTYTGISVFRREFMDYLPERGSLVEGIERAIEDGRTILAHRTDAFWMDAGSIRLYGGRGSGRAR